MFILNHNYLSPTEKVDANILVIEGWIPSSAIELATREFYSGKYDKIITVGIESSEYHSLYSDGMLEFDTQILSDQEPSKENHLIELELHSKKGGKNKAFFHAYINDSLMMSNYASVRKKKYPIIWTKELSEIESITIEFDSDHENKNLKSRLEVKGILINKSISIPYNLNARLKTDSTGGNKSTEVIYSSYADIAKQKLIKSGVDPSCFLSLTSKFSKNNRTLSCALEIERWHQLNWEAVTGINLVSYGQHAKRTHLIYSKILKQKLPVGIISMPVNDEYYLDNIVRFTMKEYLGLAYYRMLLLFY